MGSTLPERKIVDVADVGKSPSQNYCAELRQTLCFPKPSASFLLAGQGGDRAIPIIISDYGDLARVCLIHSIRFQVNVGSGRSRIRFADNSGNLVIQDVRSADSGSYVCKAENMVGIRETPAARVRVHSEFSTQYIFCCGLSCVDERGSQPASQPRVSQTQRSMTSHQLT